MNSSNDQGDAPGVPAGLEGLRAGVGGQPPTPIRESLQVLPALQQSRQTVPTTPGRTIFGPGGAPAPTFSKKKKARVVERLAQQV